MTTPHLIRRLFVANVLAWGIATPAHSAFIDFNSAGALTSNFTFTSNLVETEAIGIGGSRAVQVQDSTLGLTGLSGLSSSAGTTLTASMSFKANSYGALNDAESFTEAGVGFATASSTHTQQALLATWRNPDINIQTSSGIAGGVAGSGSGFSLTGNNWYKLNASFTKSATYGSWTYEVQLYSLGLSGTDTPSLVGSGTLNASASNEDQEAFYNAATLYPTFYLSPAAASQYATVDNLSFNATAVPEPATSAVMVGVLSLTVGLWRRAQKTSSRSL